MCVLYYFFPHSIHAGYITRCVCFTIICNILYIQTELLQCYYFFPKYLDQSIRSTQPVNPVRSKEIFQFIQQGPSEVLDHFDSVLFPDAKLQEKVMSYTCRHLEYIEEQRVKQQKQRIVLNSSLPYGVGVEIIGFVTVMYPNLKIVFYNQRN